MGVIRDFEVPGLPVGKQRPRVVRAGGNVRTYTPTKTVNYESAVRAEAMAAGCRPAEGPITVKVVAMWPWPKSWSKKRRTQAEAAYAYGALTPKDTKPDGDNVAKAVCDALEGVAYLHDGQVWDVTARTVWGPRAATFVLIEAGGHSERWWTEPMQEAA